MQSIFRLSDPGSGPSAADARAGLIASINIPYSEAVADGNPDGRFPPISRSRTIFSWKRKENATMLTDKQQTCVNLAESGHNLAILGQVSTFSSFVVLPIFPQDEHEGCWHINHRVLFSLGPVLHLRKHRFER